MKSTNRSRLKKKKQGFEFCSMLQYWLFYQACLVTRDTNYSTQLFSNGNVHKGVMSEITNDLHNELISLEKHFEKKSDRFSKHQIQNAGKDNEKKSWCNAPVGAKPD